MACLTGTGEQMRRRATRPICHCMAQPCSGYTLMELLVVLAIVALLLSLKPAMDLGRGLGAARTGQRQGGHREFGSHAIRLWAGIGLPANARAARAATRQ